MYCSSCGGAVAQGLSYCNFCGAKLSGAKADSVAKSSELKPEALVATMAALFIFGLLAIAVLMGVMKTQLDLNAGVVIAFTMLSFLLLLTIEGVFIRLLLRGRRGADVAGDNVLPRGQETKELDGAQARALSEPATSVTDHTTRTLKPVYNERTSK